jgi:quercetin dioxygenase-like cupin family protein
MPHVVEHVSVPAFALPGLEHRTLAGAAQGLAAFEVWHQSLAPGASSPPHSHDCDEVVVLLAGVAEIAEGDDVRRVRAPATAVLPAGRVHRIACVGDGPLALVAILAAAPPRTRGADGAPLPLPWDA